MILEKKTEKPSVNGVSSTSDSIRTSVSSLTDDDVFKAEDKEHVLPKAKTKNLNSKASPPLKKETGPQNLTSKASTTLKKETGPQNLTSKASPPIKKENADLNVQNKEKSKKTAQDSTPPLKESVSSDSQSQKPISVKKESKIQKESAISSLKQEKFQVQNSVPDQKVVNDPTSNTFFGVTLRKLDNISWGVKQKKTPDFSSLEEPEQDNEKPVTPSSKVSDDAKSSTFTKKKDSSSEANPNKSSTMNRKATSGVRAKIVAQKLGDKIGSQYHSYTDLSEIAASAASTWRRKSVSEDTAELNSRQPLTRKQSISDLLKLYRTKSQTDLSVAGDGSASSKAPIKVEEKKFKVEENKAKPPVSAVLAPLKMSDVKIFTPMTKPKVQSYKPPVKDIVRISPPLSSAPQSSENFKADSKILNQLNKPVLSKKTSSNAESDIAVSKACSSGENTQQLDDKKTVQEENSTEKNIQRLTGMITPPPYVKVDEQSVSLKSLKPTVIQETVKSSVQKTLSQESSASSHTSHPKKQDISNKSSTSGDEESDDADGIPHDDKIPSYHVVKAASSPQPKPNAPNFNRFRTSEQSKTPVKHRFIPTANTDIKSVDESDISHDDKVPSFFVPKTVAGKTSKSVDTATNTVIPTPKSTFQEEKSTSQTQKSPSKPIKQSVVKPALQEAKPCKQSNKGSLEATSESDSKTTKIPNQSSKVVQQPAKLNSFSSKQGSPSAEQEVKYSGGQSSVKENKLAPNKSKPKEIQHTENDGWVAVNDVGRSYSSSDDSDSDSPRTRRTDPYDVTGEKSIKIDLEPRIVKTVPKNRFASSSSEDEQVVKSTKPLKPKEPVVKKSEQKIMKPEQKIPVVNSDTKQKEGEKVKAKLVLTGEMDEQTVNIRPDDKSTNSKPSKQTNVIRETLSSSEEEPAPKPSRIPLYEQFRTRKSSSSDETSSPMIRTYTEPQIIRSPSDESSSEPETTKKASADEDNTFNDFDPYAIGRMIVRGARKRDSTVKRPDNYTHISNATIPPHSPFSPTKMKANSRRFDSDSDSASDDERPNYLKESDEGIFSASVAIVQ